MDFTYPSMRARHLREFEQLLAKVNYYDDDLFREALKAAFEDYGVSAASFREKWHMSHSTLSRWLGGTNLLRHNGRETLMGWLRSEVLAQASALESGQPLGNSILVSP